MTGDGVIPFRQKMTAAVVHFDQNDLPPLPIGPFTVTISNEDGKIYEAVFPDASGNLPSDAYVTGTAGVSDLMVNLMTGMLRISSGRFIAETED